MMCPPLPKGMCPPGGRNVGLMPRAKDLERRASSGMKKTESDRSDRSDHAGHADRAQPAAAATTTYRQRDHQRLDAPLPSMEDYRGRVQTLSELSECDKSKGKSKRKRARSIEGEGWNGYDTEDQLVGKRTLLELVGLCSYVKDGAESKKKKTVV